MASKQRADEGNAIFVRTMPTIEISDGMVFIGTARGTFAMPVSQYKALRRQGGAALAEHDAANGANIAPLCEACRYRGSSRGH